jgi:hypothetical protein
MTLLAIGPKTSGLVVRNGCAFIILTVTIDTFRRKTGIVRAGMTCLTILDVVPSFQWEKIMIDLVSLPPWSVYAVALCAIQRKTGGGMVRVFRGLIIVAVTIDTIISDPVKTELCFRRMTIDASQGTVDTDQGKPILLVEFRNSVHQPGFRCVTTNAVIPDTLTVYVLMTRDTFGWCFGKDQRLVAVAAVHRPVGSLQSKTHGVVVEMKGVNVYFPSSCIMTCATIDDKGFPMWALSPDHGKLKDQQCQ